eukprot:6077699-Amphidinium_carterae.1
MTHGHPPQRLTSMRTRARPKRDFGCSFSRFAMHEPCWDFVDHTAYRDARNTGAPGSPEELEACLASGAVCPLANLILVGARRRSHIRQIQF